MPSPSDPQSLNRYSYVNNRPTVFVDPTGHAYDAHGDNGSIYIDDMPHRVRAEYLVRLYLGIIRGGGTLTETEGLLLRNSARDLAQMTGSETAVLFNSAMAEGSDDQLAYYRNNAGNLTSAEQNDFLIMMVIVGLEGLGQWGDAQSMKLGASGSTLYPGPFAADSIPARGPERNWTRAEQGAINAIGRKTGCHTCGTKNPGTSSGNFVPDHQPVSALNVNQKPQQLYPHCITCSRRQGGQVRNVQRIIQSGR